VLRNYARNLSLRECMNEVVFAFFNVAMQLLELTQGCFHPYSLIKLDLILNIF
jgi:hypothetical protein